jgi:hypothetical protein
MSQYKAKGWDLLIRSIDRQTPKPKRSRNKNQTPEKDVQKRVTEWAKLNHFYLHVVESKAVYSQASASYLRGQVEPGFPDLVGNDSSGCVVYVELKALGKRSNLSELQYEFLRNKINQGCFAVCVDSPELLSEFYYKWKSSKNPQSYLLSVLPVPPRIAKRDKNFSDEFGF